MQNVHSSTPPAHIQALLLWVVVLPRGAVTGVCCGCRDFQQGKFKALAFHLCSWVLSVQGLLPNLIKLAPAAGISWYVFEETKLLLGVDPRT